MSSNKAKESSQSLMVVCMCTNPKRRKKETDFFGILLIYILLLLFYETYKQMKFTRSLIPSLSVPTLRSGFYVLGVTGVSNLT